MRLMAGKNLCDEHHQQRQLDESFDHLSDCLEEPRSYAHGIDDVTLHRLPAASEPPYARHQYPLFKMCAKKLLTPVSVSGLHYLLSEIHCCSKAISKGIAKEL
jgi:hypothetical protein